MSKNKRGVIDELQKEINEITSFWGHVPRIITRLIRYTSVSGLGFLIDIALLFFLVEFIFLNYKIAAALTFTIAYTTNYFLVRKWGFRGTKITATKGYLYFILFGFFGLFLTIFFLSLLVDGYHIYYITARIIIAICLGLANFSLNYFVTFRMAHKFAQDLVSYSTN